MLDSRWDDPVYSLWRLVSWKGEESFDFLIPLSKKRSCLFFFFFKYLFIWLSLILVVAYGIYFPNQGLNRSPWHWKQSLSHWVTREVPKKSCLLELNYISHYHYPSKKYYRDMINVLLAIFYKIMNFLDNLVITRKITWFSVFTASWRHSSWEWGFPRDGVPGLHEALFFLVGLCCTAGR